jgi:hypothetical protein
MGVTSPQIISLTYLRYIPYLLVSYFDMDQLQGAYRETVEI